VVSYGVGIAHRETGVVPMAMPVFRPGNPLPREEAERYSQERQDARDKDPNAVADSNAATAPGKICELCGGAIQPDQEARLRVDGEWIHEGCPIR
jgi:hypothetical protein